MKKWKKIVFCTAFCSLYIMTGIIVISVISESEVVRIDIAAFAIVGILASIVGLKIVERVVAREQRRWS